MWTTITYTLLVLGIICIISLFIFAYLWLMNFKSAGNKYGKALLYSYITLVIITILVCISVNQIEKEQSIPQSYITNNK